MPFAMAQAPDQQEQQANQQPALQAPPSPQAAPPAAQQTPGQSQAPAATGPVIVLNPAHGGTDTGARGQNAAMEKDLVLQMARGVKAELERQGFRVVMTRNDDSNPSYDDRAAMANAHNDAIFVSLHIASTGRVGTVRAYYDQMSTLEAPLNKTARAEKAVPPVGGLNSWNEAQRAYLNSSHHLADLIQVELAQKFSGSADTSLGAAVRGLRSVAGPAVAIELSSVSASDPAALANSVAVPLGDAIVTGVTAFRATAPGTGKQ